MTIDDVTDIEELRRLREEIDNKIQLIKKEETDKKVELAAENFTGKFFLQYECHSELYMTETNMNKYDIIYISEVQSINRELVFCKADVCTIDYDLYETYDLTEAKAYDSVGITCREQDAYIFDTSHDYEEIDRETAVKLVKQAKKDASTVVDKYVKSIS